MALIYVMLLLLCAFTGAWPALCGRFKRWRKHGVFVLLTTATSIAIWVAWIVMYTYGNRQHHSPRGTTPRWPSPSPPTPGSSSSSMSSLRSPR